MLYGTQGVMKLYTDPVYSLIIEYRDGRVERYATDRITTNAEQKAGKRRNTGVINEFVDAVLEGRPPAWMWRKSFTPCAWSSPLFARRTRSAPSPFGRICNHGRRVGNLFYRRRALRGQVHRRACNLRAAWFSAPLNWIKTWNAIPIWGMLEGNALLRAAAIAAPQDIDALPPCQQCKQELEIYHQLFPYALRELRAMGPGAPILAEGAGFLPELMRRAGVDSRHYICLIPEPPFSGRAIVSAPGWRSCWRKRPIRSKPSTAGWRATPCCHGKSAPRLKSRAILALRQTAPPRPRISCGRQEAALKLL